MICVDDMEPVWLMVEALERCGLCFHNVITAKSIDERLGPKWSLSLAIRIALERGVAQEVIAHSIDGAFNAAFVAARTNIDQLEKSGA